MQNSEQYYQIKLLQLILGISEKIIKDIIEKYNKDLIYKNILLLLLLLLTLLNDFVVKLY